ncbi:MAG TPA: hypothetical protein VGD69_30510 [Herpetosiphonaceae bacterium]
MAKFTTDTAATFGKRGGSTTVKRHGRSHMSTIGKRGFEAMVQKYWKGDRAACLRRLKELGLMAQDSAEWNGAWSNKPQRPGEPW